MRKFKIALPVSFSKKLKSQARAQAKRNSPPPEPPGEDFEDTMKRAFPEHLRGSISGCCDSMQDGHGTT